MTHAPAPPASSPEAERRRGEIDRWQRRSRLIHRLRRLLPFAMGLILLGLIVAAVVAAVMARYQPPVAQSEGVRLVNPRFYGRDDRGQAYVLAAESAERDPRRESRIALTEPDMTLNSEGARSTRIQADRGLYREDEKVLELKGDVRLKDAGGFQFRTEEAVVDTRTNVVRGAKSLEGSGPTGRIAADSYAIYDGGARTRLSGKVRGRITRVAPPQSSGQAR